MHLDATEYFISSRALMIAQISAVNMDAESGNYTVFDGKTVAQATEFPVNHLYKQECNHGTCHVFP